MNPTSELLQTTRDARGVVTLTLNDPARFNALGADMLAALQQALASAEPMVAEHIEWALATLAVRQEKEDKKTRLLIRCIEKGLPDHA